MNCASCHHDNRPGRRFCAECGKPLVLACPACAAANEPGEKFCGDCGAPLVASPAPAASTGGERGGSAPAAASGGEGGARKVVTIIFADLVGSTALHERLDAESAQRLMDRYYDVLRAVVEDAGGAVVKLLGDGVMAAFGLRQVAEDDALRAVRAAVAMQEAFAALAAERSEVLGQSGLRVAVHSGEVVVSGDHDDVVGDPVNVAARLQDQGGSGEVVLGETTRRLVAARVTLAPLGSVTLKGRSEAVAAYRLVSLDPPAEAAVAPFVGREEELRRLGMAFEVAVRQPASKLAVLLGSPGLGKSRLLQEFMRRHGEDATVLAAHCDVAGGATFAPLARAFRSLLGLGDGATGEAVRRAVEAAMSSDGEGGETARIVRGVADLLEGSPAPPEETFFVVRRFLVALTAANPVVVVIDDLQWAEPLFLDLLEHLVQWGGGVPLFVLGSARPELRDLRSSMVVPGGLVSDVVTLGGLDAGAAMRLAANVIGAADLPAAVAARVLATSEGNPLFVSELVRMLVQEGALRKVDERWVEGEGLASLEMPPTIHALLAARIERLRPEERFVLERAAVVGRHFSRGAVAALLGGEEETLDARLEVLTRSELIERDTGWFLGEPAQRFHHLLIRDAAYRRLLKGTRAELHARLADWIEARVGEASDQDETIGRHLEQAHHLLRELGPLDEAGRRLGERASTRLAAAGRRALARDDLGLAAGLLGRALECRTATDPVRAELALDWCEALLAAGEVGPAVAAIEELTPFAADSERLRAWQTCFLSQRSVLTEPENLQATATEVAAAAAALEGLEDAAGEAKAHSVHAAALVRLGKVGACEAALDRALAAARRAGDRRRANAVLAGAPVAALWGPSPVTRASGRCLDVVRVLRITQGAPAVEAVALSCQGVLEALRGRIDAARRMVASARQMVEELGIAQRLFEADVLAARIDLLENDAPSAERLLRSAYDGLRRLGLGIDAARAGALLARARLAQGDADDAETLSHESELLAGDDLQAAIAWRGVRAEALASRGEFTQAVELARAAVAIAAATDALLDHAEARLALAATLRAAGQAAEANAETRQAVRLWEAKGATLLVERRRGEASEAGEVAVAAAVDGQAASDTLKPSERRVRPNAATAALARGDAAFLARDLASLMAIGSADYVETDHRLGVTYGRDAMEESVRRLLRTDDAEFYQEPVATLGESLVLARRRLWASSSGGSRFDVGAFENDSVFVAEVNDDGLLCREEVFGLDHFSEAIACLYRWHAESLPQGPARDRAAATSRALGALAGAFEADRVAAACSADVEVRDHRRVGFGVLRGAEAVRGAVLAMADLSETIELGIDDVLALDDDGLVMLSTTRGATSAGGPFERPACERWEFGPDGRIARWERFDVEDQSQALRQPADGGTSPGKQSRIRRRVRANSAVNAARRWESAIAEHDDAGLVDVFHPDMRGIDHTNGLEVDRAIALHSFRKLLLAGKPLLQVEPLAALGGRLALVRRQVTSTGLVTSRMDVGSYRIDNLDVTEADEHDRIVTMEVFGSDQLNDAIVVLYRRYAALLPEGREKDRAAATARSIEIIFSAAQSGDLSALPDAVSPDLRSVDRRQLGLPPVEGVDDAMRSIGSFFELADGDYLAADILALGPRGFVNLVRSSGRVRSSGGDFENLSLMILLFDDDGRLSHSESYDVGNQAQAVARFAELCGDAPAEWSVGDDEADRAWMGAASSAAASPGSLFSNAATRLNEKITRAWNSRDTAALEALHSPTMRSVDRRRLLRTDGTGVEGLTNLRYFFEIPNSRVRVRPLATRGERLALSRLLIQGEAPHDGGPVEIECLVVDEVDEEGRSDVVVFFDPDDQEAAFVELETRYESGEAARSRFEQLRDPKDAGPAVGAGGSLGRFENDARRVGYRVGDRWRRRDWPGFEELFSPEFLYQDRQSTAHLDLDRDGYMRFVREVGDFGSRSLESEVIGTRGERLSLARVRLLVADGDVGPSEMNYLVLLRTDGRGLILEQVRFGPEDLEAAWAEMDRRYKAHEGADLPLVFSSEDDLIGLVNQRQWDGFTQWYAKDFVSDDQRMAGFGTIRGGGPHQRAIRAMIELAPDARLRIVHLRAVGRCSIAEMMWHGTRDGGAFESPFVSVFEVDETGAMLRQDVFDPAHVDRAWARFDEACAADRNGGSSPGGVTDQPTSGRSVDPAAAVRIPPNEAWRANDLWLASSQAGRWEDLKKQLAPGYVFKDGRRLVRVEGGADMAVENARQTVGMGAWAERTLLATAGDRLMLQRVVWRSRRKPDSFEIEALSLIEVDEQGRTSATIIFDADDERGAHAELIERFAAMGYHGMPAAFADYGRALNAHDFDALLATVTDRYAIVDHRRTGMGRLEGGETHVEALKAVFAMTTDWRVDTLFYLATGPRGAASVARSSGLNHEGGPFESYYAVVASFRGGKVDGLEFFEPEDLDRALARYQEIAGSGDHQGEASHG